MAEIATIARPYAEAVVPLGAGGEGPRGLVRRASRSPAAIAADPQMADLLGNPRLTRAQKLEVFFGVGGDRLSAQLRNLVTILVDGARAVLLPEIVGQFDELKRAHESVLKVRIVSARPLARRRARRPRRRARPQVRRARSRPRSRSTPRCIGGARVHVGDEVIHASMRDALAQMAVALAR